MARDSLRADHGLDVIAGFFSPVHEGYKKKGLVSGKHRVEMCELSCERSDWISVDAWESQQSAPTLTVEVLDSLQSRLEAEIENVQVMLLAGSDLILSFAEKDLWSVEDLQRILGEYGCVIVERNDFTAEIQQFLWTDPICYENRRNIYMVPQHIQNNVCSSSVRLAISRSLSVKYLLIEKVLAYIIEHGLYRSENQ